MLWRTMQNYSITRSKPNVNKRIQDLPYTSMDKTYR